MAANEKHNLETLAAVLAPTTLITALLVYVGWTRNRAFYGSFGIDQGLLKPSIQDYVLRSSDVTFGAVARLVAIALVFLVLDRLVVMVLNRVHGKWLVRVLAAVGLVLLVGGVLAMLGLIGTPPLLSSIFLGVGAVLTLRFVPALIFRGKKIEGFSWRDHAALYTALILALFWAATLYAQELGERAARNVDANPASLSLVTIFSKEHLDLPGSDVRPDMVTGLDNRPYYRYSGLSLLAYSNDRLFLVTGRYSSDFRPSIAVIRDTDAVRFEIAAPR